MISYQTLPTKLYAKVSPEPVSAPAMVIFNHALVQELELQKRPIEEWVGILSGNQPYPGQTPFSMALHRFLVVVTVVPFLDRCFENISFPKQCMR